MKTLTALFLLLAASALGQTVKTLAYNTTNGEVVYTNTNALYFTNPIVGFAKPPVFKVLTNNFSLTNQTNMTTVDGLTFDTAANKFYVVKMLPIMQADTSSTVLQVVASNCTVLGYWNGIQTFASSTNAMTNFFGFSLSATRSPAQLFYVIGGTNAGSVSLQMASSVGTNVNTMLPGSFVHVQEVTPQ